ncbi:hypothetical protein TIFTF001_029044 [Ficus carica]|uniref:Uncharacterized protein n=1 Tax=Ficus carica TaxID=3494 RepID=A0AA88DRF9_FICCA|nr:hypothetical protein TIFTF001_029044 [Ficus carica]
MEATCFHDCLLRPSWKDRASTTVFRYRHGRTMLPRRSLLTVVEASSSMTICKNRRGSTVLPRWFFETVVEATASTTVFRNRVPPRVFA